MNPMLHYGLTAVAAFIAWGASRNFDGPVLHIAITVLVAWLAWKMLASAGV